MNDSESISIDEDMREALLDWVRQFSKEFVSWQDLKDGLILNDIMSKITQNDAWNDKRKSLEKLKLNMEDITSQGWTHLIDTILTFYQEHLQYLIFIKPPDTQVICDNLHSDEAIKEVELTVLMMLGCAVQCRHKRQFVEQIRSLNASRHPAIVRCIKEITERPDNFLHISQISSDKFSLISNKINNNTTEQQRLTKRIIEMKQEILALKSSCQGKRHLNDTGDDNEVGSRDNVNKDLNDLLEVREQKIKELKSLLDDRTDKLEDTKEYLESSRKKIAFLEEQNIALQREGSMVDTYMNELEVANERASQLSHLERRNSKLQKKLGDLEFWKQQASHVTEENEKMRRSNERLEDEIDATKEDVERLKFYESEVVRCQKELKEIAEERRKDKDVIRKLVHEKEKLEKENIKLTNDNKSLRDEFQFDRPRRSDIDREDNNDAKKETTKLDESFVTLYDLGTNPESTRPSLTIETARLIDIDGTFTDTSTQTGEDINQRDDDNNDDDDDDGMNEGQRNSWKVSTEEFELRNTVESLSTEIKRLKDFVKLKDASILLMNLRVNEKTKECERLMAEVGECKRSHQMQIDQLKAQNSSHATGTETLRSRLAASYLKIDSLKLEREKIQQELNSFSERVTYLLIENNKLEAQQEFSMKMCSKVEDENVKLLDQLKDTLSQNHELLSVTLTSKDHHAEEQKSFIEQLSELKHNKEKLEEKIFEYLRKKEKKSFGFGTLVRKMKNKPTKSEQFLMSLDSPRKISEKPPDNDSKDSESKNKYFEEKRVLNPGDKYSPSSHASTSCLLPPRKVPRNVASKLSFSQTVRTNMADNKKLFKSEMNVTRPDDDDDHDDDDDDDGGSKKYSKDKTVEDLSVDGKIITDLTSKNINLQKSVSDDNEHIGDVDETVRPCIDDDENQIQEISSQKDESTNIEISSVYRECSQSIKTDQSLQITHHDDKTNDDENEENTIEGKAEESVIAVNNSDLKDKYGYDKIKDENNSEVTCTTKLKTSKELANSRDGKESLSTSDVLINTSKSADAKQNEEVEVIVKGSRSTSVPQAHGISRFESIKDIDRRSNQRTAKRFRAFSEWNIRSNEMKATKPPMLKTSLKSAFSAAGRKIVREMSNLKGMVSWKGSSFKQDKSQKTLTPEFKGMGLSEYENPELSGFEIQSDFKNQKIDCSTPYSVINKMDSNTTQTSTLTFENLAERRPPKIVEKKENQFDSKLEATNGNNKDQISTPTMAKPRRKKQAPSSPEDQVPSSSNSSSSSFSRKQMETKKSSPLSSSSSLSSSPKLSYKESNVCI